MQDFMTTSEAAEKWGITPRQVQNLCKKGQIKNAKNLVKVGQFQLIHRDRNINLYVRLKQNSLISSLIYG